MKLERGGVTIEREVRLVGPGLAGLKQRFTGSGERVVVTHEASLVSRVQVLRGAVRFGAFTAPEAFVLSVPPRSTARIAFEDAVVEADGLGCLGPLDAAQRFPRGPLHVAAPLAEEPVLELARLALHEHLSELAPVRAAAAAAGLNAETLTRAFLRAYGVTPKQYVTKARLFDAAIALFTGAPIVSAALASGFNDVSRFYAQFRKMLGARPGDYVRARAPAPP